MQPDKGLSQTEVKDVRVFQNAEFGMVSVLVDESGEPWFDAKDVCKVLGLSDPHQSCRYLDDDEKGRFSKPTPGGRQMALHVSEPGLYKLVMKSRTPLAKRFQRWVTHTVLPSIRRHGAYATDETVDRILADPDFGIRLLTALKDERGRSAALEAENAELRPKALYADAVAASDGTCLVGELAKIMRQNGVDVGQNRLFEWLRRDGYLGNSGCNRNVPTQRAMDMGLFRIKETVVTHADGHTTVTRTPKVTPKGRIYFVNRYCDKGAA